MPPLLRGDLDAGQTREARLAHLRRSLAWSQDIGLAPNGEYYQQLRSDIDYLNREIAALAAK